MLCSWAQLVSLDTKSNFCVAAMQLDTLVRKVCK